MIVITHPIAINNEVKIIHSLFAEGLSLLHVRKPDYCAAEMKSFLDAVGWEFNNRIVLHSHHHLAEVFGINRLHFPKKFRNTITEKKDAFFSTSTHSISEFNVLKKEYDYAFLSPVFQSISKTGYTASDTDHLKAITQRTNFTAKLIALGGISSENIQQALSIGFDDVALLGTIWNSTNPLENFKRCQQIALSF